MLVRRDRVGGAGDDARSAGSGLCGGVRKCMDAGGDRAVGRVGCDGDGSYLSWLRG